MGGGQTMDINKAVAATYRKNWISFATALTTDAPTFTHTIINNPGAQNELMFHYKNPDYVVVDTEITIKARLDAGLRHRRSLAILHRGPRLLPPTTTCATPVWMTTSPPCWAWPPPSCATTS